MSEGLFVDVLSVDQIVVIAIAKPVFVVRRRAILEEHGLVLHGLLGVYHPLPDEWINVEYPVLYGHIVLFVVIPIIG